MLSGTKPDIPNKHTSLSLPAFPTQIIRGSLQGAQQEAVRVGKDGKATLKGTLGLTCSVRPPAHFLRRSDHWGQHKPWPWSATRFHATAGPRLQRAEL